MIFGQERRAQSTDAATVPRQGVSDPPPVSFEEFKLYYESTERVTERRLAMNRWNYSVSVAVLIAVGGVLTWSASKEPFTFVGICGVIVLCVIASLLCTFWIRQIDDYKALNNAKFAVLNDMAYKVVFEGSNGRTDARSYRPFEQEWEILKKGENLRRAPSGRIRNALVLSSSGAEYYIPKAFRLLFLSIAGATALFAISSWSFVTQSISPFSRPSPSPSVTPNRSPTPTQASTPSPGSSPAASRIPSLRAT